MGVGGSSSSSSSGGEEDEEKMGGKWVTSSATFDSLQTCLVSFPKELVKEIVSFLVFSGSPPTFAPLPPSIRSCAKDDSAEPGTQQFLDNLLGSSVYLIYNRFSRVQQQLSGPIARSPFLIVWSTTHYELRHTYFGLVFPSISFDVGAMSLAFGQAQDHKTLELPRRDCSLVFYDLDVAQQNPTRLSQLPQPDVDYTICRIKTLNLASHHNRNYRRQKSTNNLYPVLVVRIPQLLRDTSSKPFYEKIFPVDLFAPASHPIWPWNHHRPATHHNNQ